MSNEKTGLPVYVLTAQSPRTGEYMKTLHDWGALPEIVPVLNLAKLLALLCGHDVAALSKVFQGAIENDEVKYWSWAASPSGGVWRAGEPTYFIHGNEGILHLPSMGIRPADAVALLEDRGRDIPPELSRFKQARQPDAPSVKTPGATEKGRRMKRSALIEANRNRWSTVERDLKDAAENGLSSCAKADVKGWWWEGLALRWAEDRGKLTSFNTDHLNAGLIHRMK